MLEESLSFALALLVDLIDADLLIPRGDGEVFTGGREAKVGDAVLWGLIERDILGDVARSVGLACRRGGRGSANATKE